MKAEELKTKTPDELKKLLLEQRKAQFNLRFQRSQGALADTAEIRKTRRNIARLKTFLKQGAQTGQPKKAPAAQTKTASPQAKTKAKKKAAGKAAA